MVDEEVVAIARDRIRLELGKLRAKVGVQVGIKKAQGAAQGNSGRVLVNIAQLRAEEAEQGAILAWEILHRVITTTGVDFSDRLEAQLREVLDQTLPASTLEDFERNFATAVGANEKMIEGFRETIRNARAQGLARAHNEVALFAAALKRRAAGMTGRAPTVFNNYAPVGAILTGDFASALVNQSLDAEGKTRLADALTAIEQAIARLEGTAPFDKREVIEVVQEAKGEVVKAQPNRTKLGALLGSLTATIQTVADLKPAYEQLKTVLEAVGISL